MNTTISLKDIIKHPAYMVSDTSSDWSNSVVTYKVTDGTSGYHISIDLSDKTDVGENAVFEKYYDKAIILMRWIRRSIDNNTIVKV